MHFFIHKINFSLFFQSPSLLQQIKTYDLSFLKETAQINAETKRIEKQRTEKLEEYNRRMKILEELDIEDQEDGL